MKMKVKDYEKFVLGVMSPDSMATIKDQMATMALGLSGEAGEVTDIVKKVLYHGLPYDAAVKDKLVKELGDILFYATFAARAVCGKSVKEIMEINRDKLFDRYKTGKFSKEAFLAKEKAKEKDSACQPAQHQVQPKAPRRKSKTRHHS